MIRIEDYDPRWPEEFERINLALQKTLGTLVLSIDHIGSTSVPGMAAKDVIDIQITAKNLNPKIKQKLINAGYHCHEHTSDHVPLGEEKSPSLWSKFLFSQPAGERRINIHVRVLGNPNQRYALLFRDYLRTHPNAAQTIGLIKKEIAKRHADDMESYYDIKDPIYDLIWQTAKEWSKNT